jgi:hypothetical protein
MLDVSHMPEMVEMRATYFPYGYILDSIENKEKLIEYITELADTAVATGRSFQTAIIAMSPAGSPKFDSVAPNL